MKRCVCLGMGNGDLWLALAGEQVPVGAVKLDGNDAKFWLRQSVPPMAHPTLLHAISDIADALGYAFHGATPFADHEWVMDTLESALADKRLVAFRLTAVEGGGKAPVQPEQPAKPQPKVTPVNPLIEPAKLVLVVRKFAKDPASGKDEPYTSPKRHAVKLKTDAAFDGTATFSCDKPDKVKFFSAAKAGTEIKFDGTANVFKPNAAPAWAPAGSKISSGVTVFAEGAKPSDGLDDIKLTLALAGGSKPTGPDDSSTVTSVEVTLDICKSRPSAGAEPPKFSKDDKVHVGRNLLVQNKTGNFERAQLVVGQVKPAAFKGTLVLKAKTAAVDVFKTEDGKPAGQVTALPFQIAADKVGAAGEKLWAQGKAASAAMRDSGFVLGIKDVDDEGDRVTATSVQIDLDICKTRTAAQAKATPKADPSALADPDKVKVGRFVHEQDTGNHHGRALLLVRAVKPAKFDGKLVLDGVTVKTELYPNERPTGGEAVIAVPHTIDYKTEKNEDKKFWVQGKTVSGALIDTGYVLHLKDDAKTNGDNVKLTVCKLTHLKADISSTPPVTARGNASARHTHEITGAAPAHWDFDDANNKAVVLIEDSILATNPIKLSVQVAPANVPVSWDTPRDTRTAGGDHATIVAFTGKPTIRSTAAKPLEATLLANGAGTFHIAPFVDCNGSHTFEPTADLEPYLTMNLVLVRVQGIRNDSVGQPANSNVTRQGGATPPTATTGCRVTTGVFTSAAGAAAYSKATVKVIGGGPAGQRGLDRVFSGWSQHIGATGTSASVPQGLDIFGRYQVVPPPAPPPPPPPPPPAPPVFHQQFFIFTRSAAKGTTFGPPPAAAPVVDACPVLDTSNTTTGGTGGTTPTGQMGRNGSFTPVVPVVKAVGQEWTVDTLDSPGVGLRGNHANFANTRMVAFRFNIDFRLDLVFWTNLTKVVGPSGDPASNLYSSVQTNTWTVRFSTTFNPTTGAPIGAIPAVRVVLRKDGNATRRATPVAGMGLETRAPVALNVLSIDATA